MALEMRDECEHCHAALARDGEAYICVYECTFCAPCVQQMDGICPTRRELVRRPRPLPEAGTA